MIAFACAHCGTKLKVQDQHAGRQSKCPTCKQPLVVPLPSATLAYVPPQQIDGAESSLARAGIDGGVTLENDPAGRKPTTAQLPQRSVGDALANRKKKDQRYVIEGEIARGGMGAVLRAVDCDIRREVAVKYMLDDKDPKKKARFIEEAQINGQLEHPNIVPVYDLGIDAQKRPFIMMKLVKGRSLKEVLDELRGEPSRVSGRSAENEYSLGRLLNILVNVCNALAFAHSRHVIHRDLKPANIMLGDFGEVYVMDWGLAKVLGSGEPGASATGVSAPARSSKVVISREPDADLTQEGSVLGTPVYMPPEQATGNINAIDQRSDVYSLGAILYELLTLQPPVIKEGGQLGVLMQVVQGEIIPPEKRVRRVGEPSCVSNRTIPPELSAIAMKALAKEKENRYPTVDALRQDIERFQEGRAVSAKEDTKREMLWKFVKRNKGFSAGAAAALLILMCSTVFLFKAWWETSQAKTASEQAQKEKDDRTREAVPALVEAARLAVERRKLPNARKQVDLALLYAPENADARLLKAQLLIVELKFAGARGELESYLQLQPADTQARRLLDICSRPQPEEVGNLLALAQVLEQQEVPALANDLLTRHGSTSFEARQKLLDLYRQKINKAWPGVGNGLVMDNSGIYELSLNGRVQISNLTPLEGMPLTRLDLANTSVRDLSPLKGMPLIWLNLSGVGGITDLTHLKGMPLKELNLSGLGQLYDLSPLRGSPLSERPSK